MKLISFWFDLKIVILFAAGGPKFKITDTKLYAPVVTFSTQGNARLLQQLKPGFKRTSDRNKYQTKVSTERQKSFQRIYTFFVIIWKWGRLESKHKTLSSKSRNKRLQCYDRWKKLLISQLRVIWEIW